MFKITLLACALSIIISRQVQASDVSSTMLEFDSETLKSLGIDPAVSTYFAKESRFLPGEKAVTMIVNGQNRGTVVANFNQEGELCFNKALMEYVGMRIPVDYKNGCYDYVSKHPETIIKAVPGQDSIELVISPDAINRQDFVPTDIMTEGSGAILNYSAMSSRNEYSGGSSTYSQLQLDGGVNVAGWLLRSQQLLSQSQGQFNSENGQTYLQRTSLDLRTTARAGEVNMNNTLLEGTGLYGVTFTPETALDTPEGMVRVSGIANTSQARVEIRQQGILVHSTLVPIGPFTLTDFSVRNYTSDLSVLVIENDGSQHSYVVPSTLYLRRLGNPAGLFLSLGRVSDSYDEKPLVASVSKDWRLTSNSNANVGMIVARDFQAVGIGVDTVPWAATMLSLKVKQSYDRTHALQGQSYRTEASIAIAFGVSITLSSTYYSSGFREFSEFIDNGFTAMKKHDYSMGLQWQSPGLGAFSGSFYETKNRNNEGKTRYVTAGWGGKFRSAFISFNWQRQLNAERGNGKKDDLFYVNVNFPLGGNNVSTYARHDDNKTRYGSTLSGNLDDNSYTLGTELGREENERSVNASLSSNLHYTQLMVNGSATGQHQRNYSGSLQGGIVAHENGITLSPMSVRETFGIASLAQPVAGVKIDTPQGSVWTDARGYAVLPSLNAWQKSRIEVNTETLPKNMDIGNGTYMLNQGRGSVGKVQFNVISQRRVLMEVSTAEGKKLPKNTAITDDQGNYLTTSVDDGVVFLSNASASQVLVAQGEPASCRIKLKLPEQAEKDVFYEAVKGVCQ